MGLTQGDLFALGQFPFFRVFRKDEKMTDISDIKFRPQEFVVDVTLPRNRGDWVDASVSLNDRFFVLQMIRHIITYDYSYATHRLGYAAPPAELRSWKQDGLYRLDWSVFNQLRFFKGSVPCALELGSAETGIWVPLSAPVVLPPSQTLNLRVTNLVDRIGDGGPPPIGKDMGIDIQIVFSGVERTDRAVQ